MTKNTLLHELLENDAFKHTTIPINELPYLYEPFEKISNKKIETKIISSIQKNHVIIIKSDGGTGKTCAVNYSLLQLQDDIFPIVLSPFMEEVDEVCNSTKEFTRFVLNQTLHAVKNFSNLSKDTEKKVRDALAIETSFIESKKYSIGGSFRAAFSILPFIAKVEAGVKADLENYASKAIKSKIFNTQRIEAIRGLCETIEAHNLKPVFYIDDTDKFLKREDLDLSKLVPKFFGQILLGLIKLDRPLILAAHAYYTKSASYRDAESNYVDQVIILPELNKTGIISLINTRIKAVDSSKNIKNVFEDNAIKSLIKYYNSKKIIRNLMLICQESIDLADSQGTKVSKSMVDSFIVGK